MRKAISVAIAVGLVLGAMMVPAEAGKKKKKKPAPPAIVKVERIVELPFQCPCGPMTPVPNPVLGGNVSAGFWLAGGTFGGGPVPTGGDDQYLRIEVTSAEGTPMYAEVGQDTDGDLQAETDITSACGAGDPAPAKVPAPGVDASVFVFMGTCPDGTPSVGASGTVKMIFSNIP